MECSIPPTGSKSLSRNPSKTLLINPINTNSSAKSLLRPIIRRTVSLVESVAGFRTDPTGWLPNRLEMLIGTYEKPLMRSLRRVLPKSGVFVDIGANVGFISRQIAESLPEARVFAFEPNPRIYPILRANLKGFSNCQLFNVGLGASEGRLEFFHGKESSVGSFVPAYASQHPSNSSGGRITKSIVRVTTGDALLSQIETVDVMKIDVEGYEMEVLKGMSNLLSKGVIRTMFFELCPFAQRWAHKQPRDIIDLLVESGYTIYEIEGEREGSGVSAENIGALIARLGNRGYTTLRASR